MKFNLKIIATRDETQNRDIRREALDINRNSKTGKRFSFLLFPGRHSLVANIDKIQIN